MSISIKGGTIVNEGHFFKGDLIIENDRIAGIFQADRAPRSSHDQEVNATGCFILPGVIDEHVHFREPGMTQKADMESESRAAAYGGVTSYFEMPNTNPPTTTYENLADKFQRASRESHVNYSFFFGATNSNACLFEHLDRSRIPGIKLFMGASTGNMLVDRLESLRTVFRAAAALGVPLMTHCEDMGVISANMCKAKKSYGEDPPVSLHPLIRSAEACYKSSLLAVSLAREMGTRLHIAHVSTGRELAFAAPIMSDAGRIPQITLEACVPHLFFSADDYARKGALIKCNPAIKDKAERTELRRALSDGRIFCIGTDHAPHQLADKQGGCVKAASGMPMVQFSLVSMLELVDEGFLTIEQLVELMCHHPALLFGVKDRGFLRKGYKADVVIVRPNQRWKVTGNCIQSKCKWSPVEGHEYHWKVMATLCNGHLIYHDGHFDPDYRGEEISFEH